MSSIDGPTTGPQRRVATRKRGHISIPAKSIPTATKKLRGAAGEIPQGPKKIHTQPGSRTVHDSHLSQNSSHCEPFTRTQPLHTEEVLITNHSERTERLDGHPPSRQSRHTTKTPTKVCSRSEVQTIQHKRPLFRSKNTDSRNDVPNPADLEVSSRAGYAHSGDTQGWRSQAVWPAGVSYEEDWEVMADIDSQNFPVKSGTGHSPDLLQQQEEQEASFSSSPVPPTPRGPNVPHGTLLSSGKVGPPATDSQIQNNSFVEWDDEDSFYDKLDLDQLLADSQQAEGVNMDSTCQRSSRDAPSELPSTHSGVRTGDCPDIAGKLSPQSQVHQGTTQENSIKCSVASQKVLINGCMYAPEPPVKEECNNPLQSDWSCTHTETPQPEKWFSHIDKKTGNVLRPNSGPFSKLRPDGSSSGLLEEISGPQSCKGNVAQDARSSTAVTAIKNDIVEDISPIQSTSAGLVNQTVTPKVTSAGSRLRQRLQDNARVTTPQQTRHAELRQAKVQEALTEMLEEKSGVKDNDIGPFYGLPSKVAELLKIHRGIDQLYDWQHSCLTLPAIQEGRNLIYSLPTSGGKTLVAEILIMRQLLCNKRDSLLIVPFVSIVQEKVATLSTFAVELGFLVEEYAGSKGAIPPRKRRKKKTLYVATIEKAHSLVNSLILEGRAESLGLVVVDELHMVGDGGRRGASLEACIAKLLCLNTAHIIGMSATLSNIQDLCDFMRAEVYCSDFRPVELKEYIKIEDNIFEVNQAALCPDDRFTHSRIVTFPYTQTMRQNDPDHLVGLALEVIPDRSCLIFCATKKSCQNVAEFICKHLPKNEAKKLTSHKQREKHVLILSLRRECDNRLCPVLKRTIPYGLAYHHSGLTMDERKLIEDAYSDGTLCLLTCTSTLAAGVNLPAKRVILRSPYIAQDLLTSTRYKQMVGRAGRAGIDSSGESILIIKPKQRQEIAELLSRPIEACYSSLMHDNGKGIRSLILTLIALKLTPHRSTVLSFMNQTLFGVQASHTGNDVATLTADGLKKLLDLNLVKEKSRPEAGMHAEDSELTVTKLGQAAFKGSIDIDLCSSIYDDLKQACDQGLVLANSLHLLYLVTPYDLVSSTMPNWVVYDRLYSHLNEGDLRVAELIGVTDRYLNFKVAGRKPHRTDEDTDFRVQRFYLTLMLWKILNQTSVWDVAAKFEVPRGFVQNLFTSAASFGSSIQRFCEDLPEFWAYQQLLSKVVQDLTYCATADLVSLLEVPGVKQGRAKQLVRAGYKTLRHLAHADPKQLMQEVEHLPKKVAEQIVAAAKMELAERAEALREEAEELVTKPALENGNGK